jgi:hypothetical protein
MEQRNNHLAFAYGDSINKPGKRNSSRKTQIHMRSSKWAFVINKCDSPEIDLSKASVSLTLSSTCFNLYNPNQADDYTRLAQLTWRIPI